MTGSVTLTGKTGPASSVAAKAFSSVDRLTIDFTKGTIELQGASVAPNNDPEQFDITAVTALACVVSGANGSFAFTLS